MLYLDMLMALLVVVYLSVGIDAWSMWVFAAALAGGVAAIVVVHVLVRTLLGAVAGNVLTGVGEARIASRRKIMRAFVSRTPAEKRLEALSDDELRARVEKHPKDALAVEVLCERLLAQNRFADYARETAYLLTLKTDLSIEEKCSRYHQLADLYLTRLQRPDRAVEMLQAIVVNFPGHYQATLARRRIADLRSAGGGADRADSR